MDKVRHPAEVGLGLLLVMAVLMGTVIAPAAANETPLVPLMIADDVDIALVIADL